MSTIFITEQNLGTDYTADQARALVASLQADGWECVYGAGPAWRFEADDREKFEAAFDRALASIE